MAPPQIVPFGMKLSCIEFEQNILMFRGSSKASKFYHYADRPFSLIFAWLAAKSLYIHAINISFSLAIQYLQQMYCRPCCHGKRTSFIINLTSVSYKMCQSELVRNIEKCHVMSPATWHWNQDPQKNMWLPCKLL